MANTAKDAHASVHGRQDEPNLVVYNATDISQDVLDLFWKLASNSIDERIESAGLLRTACESTSDNNSTPSSSTKPSELDLLFPSASPLLRYCLKRLVKGLSSARESARQGFSLALSGLVGLLDTKTETSMVSVLVQYMDDSFSKKDGQDVIGHVFGLGAIVSGDERVLRSMTASDVGALVRSLVGLAGQKSFVREASGEVLVALAYRLHGLESDGDGSNGNVEQLLEAYFGCEGLVDLLHGRAAQSANGSSSNSYDGMAVGLALQLWPWMPKDVVTGCAVLAGDAKPSVGVMYPTDDAAEKGDAGDVEKKSGKKGSNANAKATKAFFGVQHLEANVRPYLKATTSTHPHMHGCWRAMLRLLACGNVSIYDHVSLMHFWETLVEGDLFDSQSHEKKYLGMMVFEELLPMVDTAGLKLLMTQKFIRCLGNNANNKQTYLNKASAQAVAALREKINGVAAVSGEDAAKIVAVVERFGGGQLAHTFASGVPSGSGPQAKEKTEGMLAEIVEMLNKAQGVRGDTCYLFHLSKVPGIVKKHQHDPEACEALFKGLVDVYVKAASSGDNDGAEKENLPVKILGSLLNGIGSLSKAHTSIEGLVKVEVGLLEHIAGSDLGSLPSTSGGITAGPSKALTELREAVWTTASKSKSLSSDNAKKLHHFLHLVCLLELYSFINPETSDDDMVDDLQNVFKECFGPSSGKKKNKRAKKVPEHGEIGDDVSVFWADVLVDCVLSVISRNETPYPSAPLRDAGELLFRYFSADITRQGLASLFDVLVQSLDGAANQARQDGDDDEEMDVDDDSDDDDDDDSDVDDNESDEDKVKDGEDDSQGGSDDDTEMPDATVDPMDATDEQMFKMDSMLGAYFASHQVKSKKQLRDDLINFKLRVMSCLEIFMRLHPDSPLLLEAPDPLLTSLSAVTRPDGSLVLQERLAGLIKNKLTKCRCREDIGAFVKAVEAEGGASNANASADDEEDGAGAFAQVLSSQLRRALYLASRTPVKLIGECAGFSYAYLMRSVHHLSPDNQSLLAIADDSLQAALTDFFLKKKTKLSKSFFPDLFRKVPTLIPAAFPILVAFAANSRSQYLQNEAVLLLGTALHMIGDDARGLIADHAEATKAMLDGFENDGGKAKPTNKQVTKALSSIKAVMS